jgi:hypothetical protein
MFRPSSACGRWCHLWAPGRGMVPRWSPGAINCGCPTRDIGPTLSVGVRARWEWCGRRDSNPHERKLNGFSYRLRLSPPGRGFLKRARQVCGLDYPFTVPRKNQGLGAARLVSTPSQSVCWIPQGDRAYLPGLARDCHCRFPRIWAVLHRRFPSRALKFP